MKFTCPHCGSAADEASQACPSCARSLRGDSATITPGMLLGDFRVERRLGGGGMGEVFLATQLSLDRRVALKVLPVAITRDPERVSDFKHEMRTLARLDHPNVATAFAAGEHGGLHFMAMAFVDGEDLADRLEREGPLPEHEALDCTLKVAEALKYAWDRYHLLHRDIKPGNIMIDRAGVVKLMDMGLSKTLHEDLGAALPAMIVGTPNYMSPAQARGEPGLSVADDIYALGATLYQLVTARLPFQAETPEAVLDAVLGGDLQPVAEIRPDLSAATVRLIGRMAARDPAARYPDWDAVIDDLGEALTGAGESRGMADVPGGTRQVRVDPGELAARQERERTRQRRARRRAAGVGVTVVLLAALAAAAGIAYVKRVQQQSAAARALAQSAEEGQHTAEQRALALEAQAHAKTVEAAVTRALVNTNLGRALSELGALRETEEDPELLRQLTEATWKIEARRQEAIKGVLDALRAEAGAVGETGDFHQAAEVYLVYEGPYSGETLAEREALAEQVRAEGTRAAEERDRRSEARYAEVQEEVVEALLDGRTSEAEVLLHGLLDEDLSPVTRVRGEELLEDVEAIGRMPLLVHHAYRKYLGRETTVYFSEGKQRVEIVEVYDDRVDAVWHGPRGDQPRTFGVEDLGLREKVVRLGRLRRADLDMIRGLLAFQGGRDESARRYLQLAEHELAALLLAAIESREAGGETAPETGEISS